MKAVQALTSCHDCAATVEQATRQWRSRQEIQSIPGQEVDDEAPAAGPLDLTHSCLKTHTQTESGRGESEGGDGRGGRRVDAALLVRAEEPKTSSSLI